MVLPVAQRGAALAGWFAGMFPRMPGGSLRVGAAPSPPLGAPRAVPAGRPLPQGRGVGGEFIESARRGGSGAFGVRRALAAFAWQAAGASIPGGPGLGAELPNYANGITASKSVASRRVKAARARRTPKAVAYSMAGGAGRSNPIIQPSQSKESLEWLSLPIVPDHRSDIPRARLSYCQRT
jgi:hypothetical protein